MTYEGLSQQNQVLYGKLELLTVQIGYYLEKGLIYEAEILKQQKEAVKYKINNNLDKIEEWWSIEALTADKRNNNHK